LISIYRHCFFFNRLLKHFHRQQKKEEEEEMDLKQIHFGNSKSILKMKDFISFIHNLEEKLSSVKIIHGKLNELMSMVSTTHETIIQELTTIKIVLNQQKINEDE